MASSLLFLLNLSFILLLLYLVPGWIEKSPNELSPTVVLVVTVCNREADLYELFVLTQERQTTVTLQAGTVKLRPLADLHQPHRTRFVMHTLPNDYAIAGTLQSHS